MKQKQKRKIVDKRVIKRRISEKIRRLTAKLQEDDLSYESSDEKIFNAWRISAGLANDDIDRETLEWLKEQHYTKRMSRMNIIHMSVLACGSSKGYKALEFLLSRYKNFLRINADHYTMAAKYNQLPTLKFLLNKELEQNLTPSWNGGACLEACDRGHFGSEKSATPQSGGTGKAEGVAIKILSWLRDEKKERDFSLKAPWSDRCCTIAVKRERFEILKWLRDESIHGDDVCPWSEYTTEEAAVSLNFEILRWLCENGCPVSYRAWLYCDDDRIKAYLEERYPGIQSDRNFLHSGKTEEKSPHICSDTKE